MTRDEFRPLFNRLTAAFRVTEYITRETAEEYYVSLKSWPAASLAAVIEPAKQRSERLSIALLFRIREELEPEVRQTADPKADAALKTREDAVFDQVMALPRDERDALRSLAIERVEAAWGDKIDSSGLFSRGGLTWNMLVESAMVHAWMEGR